MTTLVSATLYFFLAIVLYVAYLTLILPLWNPLRQVAGPPIRKWFGNHLSSVLDPSVSPKVHEIFVRRYGRAIHIRGIGPWDDRLLTLDPVSIGHVLKNSMIYEKPWQSRKLITSLIGCGMLAAEGQVHKRQRRVATPAFSIQNMRALVPLVFKKGLQLRDRWKDMIETNPDGQAGVTMDICHWVSRATFDVIGLAGFDYDFNAIQDETNELFSAYKDMFEVAISQGGIWRTIILVYAPFLNELFPDKTTKIVRKCQAIIQRDAGRLVQEKKRKFEEGERTGKPYGGKDLLSLLLKANRAVDLPPEQRISDEDILHNINTFMFAGSDTSSLSLTWMLFLLAQHPIIQDKLRAELQTLPSPSNSLTSDEIESLFNDVSQLHYLDNVVREVIRLIPPVHSSIRVATQDDEIPTSYPVHRSDGTVDLAKRSVRVPKGSFVHVPVEAFNLDKEFWGADAWEFNPDRWDHLPEAVRDLPGLYSNTLTFSAGPRSCIGLRFSMIEIKTFLYILLTQFRFSPTHDRIIKANVYVFLFLRKPSSFLML
ncbi:hypothetical protein ONZ45_g18812 [Pleurotus djamor]|nr:hypothetical protein ONZ45_g18812 [Pleurotus djamor]